MCTYAREENHREETMSTTREIVWSCAAGIVCP